MTNKRLIYAFLPYVFYIISYSCSVMLNSYLIDKYLILNSLSFTEIDIIEFYRLFGYIISPFILIIMGQLFSLQKKLIFSLILYLLSVQGTLYLPTYNILKFYNLTFAMSNALLLILLSSKMLIDTNISKKYILSFFFGSMLIGYLFSETIINMFIFDIDKINITNWIILNTIPIIGILLTIIFSKKFKISISNYQPKFSIIVKNMELEAIAGFVVFYTLMVILNGYEVYALTEHLLILSVSNIKYFMLGAILVGIYLISLVQLPNLYKVNIACIGLLTLIFSCLPYWGSYSVINAVMWVCIGLILYVFFISNVMILTEKFESSSLYYAILTFFLSGAIGFYAGYITIDATDDTFGEMGFIMSICFVQITLMVYYVLRFKKDKLSKWTKN